MSASAQSFGWHLSGYWRVFGLLIPYVCVAYNELMSSLPFPVDPPRSFGASQSASWRVPSP